MALVEFQTMPGVKAEAVARGGRGWGWGWGGGGEIEKVLECLR